MFVRSWASLSLSSGQGSLGGLWLSPPWVLLTTLTSPTATSSSSQERGELPSTLSAGRNTPAGDLEIQASTRGRDLGWQSKRLLLVSGICCQTAGQFWNPSFKTCRALWVQRDEASRKGWAGTAEDDGHSDMEPGKCMASPWAVGALPVEGGRGRPTRGISNHSTPVTDL